MSQERVPDSRRGIDSTVCAGLCSCSMTVVIIAQQLLYKLTHTHAIVPRARPYQTQSALPTALQSDLVISWSSDDPSQVQRLAQVCNYNLVPLLLVDQWLIMGLCLSSSKVLPHLFDLKMTTGKSLPVIMP